MNLSWCNVNLGVRVKINSGAALLLFLASYFTFLITVALSPAIEKNFLVGSSVLVGAFGGYLRKEHANNKLDLEAAKANVVESVTAAKQAAAIRVNCGDANATK